MACQKATVPNENEGFICPHRNYDTYYFNGSAKIWVKPFGPESYVNINVNE